MLRDPQRLLPRVVCVAGARSAIASMRNNRREELFRSGCTRSGREPYKSFRAAIEEAHAAFRA